VVLQPLAAVVAVVFVVVEIFGWGMGAEGVVLEAISGAQTVVVAEVESPVVVVVGEFAAGGRVSVAVLFEVWTPVVVVVVESGAWELVAVAVAVVAVVVVLQGNPGNLFAG